MGTLPKRLAREALHGWNGRPSEQTVERMITTAVLAALDEAVIQVRGLDRGNWPIEFEDAWREAQARFAAAIEALKG